jgi:hypothetical protein
MKRSIGSIPIGGSVLDLRETLSARHCHGQVEGTLAVMAGKAVSVDRGYNVPARRAASTCDVNSNRDSLKIFNRLPAPAVCHELNPVEPVWSHPKRSLANLAKRNLSQLTALVKTRLKRCSTGPTPRRVPGQHRARPHTFQ